MHIPMSQQTVKAAVFLPYVKDLSKSPKNMKKLLPKRKPERKPSEEDFTVRKSRKHSEVEAFILFGVQGLRVYFV